MLQLKHMMAGPLTKRDKTDGRFVAMKKGKKKRARRERDW
jgi:hypothetical protein